MLISLSKGLLHFLHSQPLIKKASTESNRSLSHLSPSLLSLMGNWIPRNRNTLAQLNLLNFNFSTSTLRPYQIVFVVSRVPPTLNLPNLKNKNKSLNQSSGISAVSVNQTQSQPSEQRNVTNKTHGSIMTVTVFYIVILRYVVISEQEDLLADKEKERRDIFERIKLMIFIVFLFIFAYLPTPGSPQKQQINLVWPKRP